jgi:hypothetical protein
MFDFELAKLLLIWDQSIDTSLYYAYVLYSKYRPLPKYEIKRRAMSKLGPISYSVLWENCEHFAAWCRNGIFKSEQV